MGEDKGSRDEENDAGVGGDQKCYCNAYKLIAYIDSLATHFNYLLQKPQWLCS